MHNHIGSISRQAPGAVTRLLRPLSGWPLEAALTLDEAASGFLAFGCGASPLWRQAFAAALAGGIVMEEPAMFLERATGEPVPDHASWTALIAEVGQLLPTMAADAIILAGMGECPEGYRGALAKIGPQPLNTPNAYVRLLDIFGSDDPLQRRRRRVLEQLSALDDERLQIVECIDPVFLAPEVAERITSVHHAHHLNSQLAAIRQVCSGANDDALRQSVVANKGNDFREWTRRWLEKADRGPSVSYPWDGDPEVTSVTPANARKVAHDWRNCLGSPQKIARLVSGTWAAAVWKPIDVIVTFAALEGGSWLLSGVYRRSNVPVTSSARGAVMSKFGALPGCILPATTPEPLQALVGAVRFDVDFGLDDLEDF